MRRLADYEYLTCTVTLAALWLAVNIGAWIAQRWPVKEEQRPQLERVTGTVLSILALIIGFSFSAAIGRYDLRKNYEEEEANAIDTEYRLADLLPEADAAQLRALLAQYVPLRVAYYSTTDYTELTSTRTQRATLESEMWAVVVRNARADRSPIMGQVLAGMANVLRRPGYSEAASRDRIPDGTWTLMAILAALSCALLGYGGHGRQVVAVQLAVPLFVALAFLVIASLDAQRRGVIRVNPENLLRLEEQWASQPKP